MRKQTQKLDERQAATARRRLADWRERQHKQIRKESEQP